MNVMNHLVNMLILLANFVNKIAGKISEHETSEHETSKHETSKNEQPFERPFKVFEEYAPLLGAKLIRELRWLAPGYLEGKEGPVGVWRLSRQIRREAYKAGSEEYKAVDKESTKKAWQMYKECLPGVVSEEGRELEKLSFYLQACRTPDDRVLAIIEALRKKARTREFWFLVDDARKYEACRRLIAGRRSCTMNWRGEIVGGAGKRATSSENRQIDAITPSFQVSDIVEDFKYIKEVKVNRLNRPLCPMEWNWAMQLRGLDMETARALVRDKKEIMAAKRLAVRTLRHKIDLEGLGRIVTDEILHSGVNASLSTIVRRAVERWRKPRPTVDANTELAKPPFIPDHPFIRFIGTVGELFAEGERMNHCVSGYWTTAVKGDCYFFHVDSDMGGKATIMLDKELTVAEVRGEYNSHNAACVWAAEFFTEVYGRRGQ